MTRRILKSARRIRPDGSSTAVCAVLAGVATSFLLGNVAPAEEYILIDEDDNIDSVCAKLQPVSTPQGYWVFKRQASWAMREHLRTGRFSIGSSEFVRPPAHHQRSQAQSGLPSSRTYRGSHQQMSAEKMMFTRCRASFTAYLQETCRKYRVTRRQSRPMFIPRHYDFYWDTSADKFLDKMSEENKKFWTFERKEEKRSGPASRRRRVKCLKYRGRKRPTTKAEMPKIAGNHQPPAYQYASAGQTLR